jgi:hypothetical protein
MKLIIAGGRRYQFTADDVRRLNDLLGQVDEVITGGSSGADECGEHWARSFGIPVRRFSAAWRTHGRAAGPIRNRDMAEYADAVALFPGGRGTASMHREAILAGLRIFDFRNHDLVRR